MWGLCERATSTLATVRTTLLITFTPSECLIHLWDKELLVAGRTHIVMRGSLARRQFQGFRSHIHIGNFAQKMANAVEASAFFVVRFHCEPWGFGNVGVGKHRVFCLRIFHPAIA